uniref:Uncharacterized protein n=4 Tax=Lepeophtheirus salmonis TaxID=72036 RepID=A0A0K2U4Y2_LEPSM
MGKAPVIESIRKIGNPQSLPIKELLKNHKIKLTKNMRIIEIGKMVIIKEDEPKIKLHESKNIPENENEIELYDVSSEKEGADEISSDEWEDMGGI